MVVTNRHRILIALSVGPLIVYAFVARGYATPRRSLIPVELGSPEPSFEMLAQASEAGIEAQERQLQQQIESDSAKLKADEAAEQAGQKPANPQRKFIAGALAHLRAVVAELRRTSNHYHGHKTEAYRQILAAHNELMQCYKIDSGTQPQ
jgi:hypothetical protein